MVECIVKEKSDNNKEGHQFGLKKLTCAMLKSELEARHLYKTGLKDILVARLEESLTSKTDGFQSGEEEYKEIEVENEIDMGTV